MYQAAERLSINAARFDGSLYVIRFSLLYRLEKHILFGLTVHKPKLRGLFEIVAVFRAVDVDQRGLDRKVRGQIMRLCRRIFYYEPPPPRMEIINSWHINV